MYALVVGICVTQTDRVVADTSNGNWVRSLQCVEQRLGVAYAEYSAELKVCELQVGDFNSQRGISVDLRDHVLERRVRKLEQAIASSNLALQLTGRFGNDQAG